MRVSHFTRLLAPVLTTLICAALAQTSEARKVEGFEAGDPAVTSTGDAGAQGAYQGQAAPEGTNQYLITTIRNTDSEDGVTNQSGSNAVAFATLNSFFFGNTVSNQDGSGVLIPFTLQAGETTLTLQYDFLSNEIAQTTPRNDSAFEGIFTTAGALQGTVNTFASVFANQATMTVFGASSPFQFHTGLQTLTLNVSGLIVGQTYDLGIGVTDVTNTSHASAVLIDNVQANIPAVPEPSTIGLIIAGAASCLAVRRRIRK
jgi:hypothetical protein